MFYLLYDVLCYDSGCANDDLNYLLRCLNNGLRMLLAALRYVLGCVQDVSDMFKRF